jgi:SAM-dependent methyltransferase
VTLVDKLLQRWRIRKVRRHLRPGARVLDVGCGDAALLRHVPSIGQYVGVDPSVADESRGEAFTLIRGAFPDTSPATGDFDAFVMLASLEHIPAAALPALAKRANALLRMHGLALITVPDRRVDAILEVSRPCGSSTTTR